jgi:hypothetical protein
VVTRRLPLLVLVCLASLWASTAAVAQEATVVARVDRDAIRANESFTYLLRAEGRFSGRPDLSALAREFEVLRSGSSSSIQIVNGQTTQVAEWTVELMPRSAGEFELPAVELDGVLSNSVRLEILPPETSSGTAADVFIEVELDRPEAYVQSQAIYTLRLHVGVATGREALTAPAVTGGEAIVEKLGGDREYQTVRGNKAYRVRERRFAVFPQTAGVLTIGPTEYQATVIPGIGFSRQQSLRSDVLELEVLPAVPPPASHPGAVWLPARALRIEESWSGDADGFEQGVPRTRELTIIADGLLETQLPELDLTESPGLRQYADQPDLSREISDAGIEARRTERFAVIANRPGAVEFPPVELPWWNVDTERWEIARIDAALVEVAPGADFAPADQAPATAEPSGVVESDPGFWPWLSVALALGWMGTIAAWAYSRRAGRVRMPRPETSRPTSVRALLKQLSAACQVDDAERTRDLLLEWAERQFGDDPPGSLGALAGRLSGELAAEILALEAALYGPAPRSWKGQRLAELIRATQAVSPRAGQKDQDPLVPLYR